MARKRRANGEGSVTYDKSAGLWVARLPRDERGKRPKVTGRTEKEARDKLRARLRELEEGRPTNAGTMTVKAFLELWLHDVVMASGGAASTIEKHEIAVRVHLVPALGRIRLAKLTPMRVQRFVADAVAAGTGPRAVQLAHRTLKQALAVAVSWGLVPRNVAALVAPPRYRPTKRRPFTPDERRAIFSIARDDALYEYVVLAYAAGLRQSELLGLCWPDLDLDGGWLTAWMQLGRDGELKALKTEAGDRAIPLPSSVVDLLRAHRERQDAQRARAGSWDERGFVFATRTGRPISHRNAHRSWTRILDRAGVEHRGVHLMRHAFVTSLAEQGVPERVAQELAGHADSRMTREVYTHVTRRMRDQAADAITRMVEDANGSTKGSIDSAADSDEQSDNGGQAA